MSYQTLTNSAQPSTPASGKTTTFVGTDGRTKAVNSTGIVNVLSSYDRYNWLRNSGFWFAQRQAPGTLTTYSSVGGRALTADGWFISNEVASTQYLRVDTATTPETGLQGRYWGQFTGITTSGKRFIGQIVEGTDTCALRGRNVRVTIWMKGIVALTPTMRLGLVQLNTSGTIDTVPSTAGNFISAWGATGTDPTLGTNLAYIAPTSGKTGDNCTANGNAYDCVLTGAWQRFSGVFTVPTNCKNLIVCVWGNAAIVNANDGYGLAQAMLTDGEETCDWTCQWQQEEYDRVARFYQKSFNIDVLPAASVAVNSGEFKWLSVVGAAAAYAGVGVRYPIRMRAAATTLTGYAPAVAGAEARNITDSAQGSGTTLTANGETGFWINGTSSAGAAAGEHIALHWSADAEL